jgi:ribulose bisphosphate carboxylase small subunit
VPERAAASTDPTRASSPSRSTSVNPPTSSRVTAEAVGEVYADGYGVSRCHTATSCRTAVWIMVTAITASRTRLDRP